MADRILRGALFAVVGLGTCAFSAIAAIGLNFSKRSHGSGRGGGMASFRHLLLHLDVELAGIEEVISGCLVECCCSALVAESAGGFVLVHKFRATLIALIRLEAHQAASSPCWCSSR